MFCGYIFTTLYQIPWHWIEDENFSEFHHGCLELYGPSACRIIKSTYPTNNTASTTDIAILSTIESNKYMCIYTGWFLIIYNTIISIIFHS